MPNITVDVLKEGSTLATTSTSTGNVEVELRTVVTSGVIVSEVEVAEVQLPDKLAWDATVKNVGGVPGILLLEVSDPVPPGTPTGTLILRKE